MNETAYGPRTRYGDFFSTDMSENMNNGKLNFSDTCDLSLQKLKDTITAAEDAELKQPTMKKLSWS